MSLTPGETDESMYSLFGSQLHTLCALECVSHTSLFKCTGIVSVIVIA